MDIENIASSFLQQIKELNPKISAVKFDQIAGQIKQRIKDEPPPSIAIIGECGVGKSSTLNALFNAGQEINHFQACTQEEAEILVRTERGDLIIYDMPGLSESLASQDKHLETYHRVLNKVDIAFWIFDAQNKAMANIQRLLKEDISKINPELVNRMVFAINKVDLIYPGSDAWITRANLPSEEQEDNITSRLRNIEKLMREALPYWRGHIVGYSATKRYNLPQLFASMLSSVSETRRWVFTERKSLADYFELVDPELLPEDRRPKKSIFTQSQPEIVIEAIMEEIPDFTQSQPEIVIEAITEETPDFTQSQPETVIEAITEETPDNSYKEPLVTLNKINIKELLLKRIENISEDEFKTLSSTEDLLKLLNLDAFTQDLGNYYERR